MKQNVEKNELSAWLSQGLKPNILGHDSLNDFEKKNNKPSLSASLSKLQIAAISSGVATVGSLQNILKLHKGFKGYDDFRVEHDMHLLI